MTTQDSDYGTRTDGEGTYGAQHGHAGVQGDTGEVREDSYSAEHGDTGFGHDQHSGQGDTLTDDRDAGGLGAEHGAATDHGTASDGGAGSAAAGGADAAGGSSGEVSKLVSSAKGDEFRSRWNELKGDFVDDPRAAVQKVDTLVGDVLDELNDVFKRQRTDLEGKHRDEQASTEDLRVAYGRYREFFERLLSL